MSGSSPVATILTVDDSPVIQNLIKRALEPEFRVLTADNATEGLSIIYHEPVAVLLLDVMMPEVDGLEFCRTIRSLPQFHNLPIVMVTSKDATFDRVQGRMAGATEYLTKPFDPEELRHLVERLLAAVSQS